MTQPVMDPRFWRERMYVAIARGEIHRLMFEGTLDELRPHDDELRDALKVLGRDDSVLDVGCGYGRALTLMSRAWRGRYVGIDVSEDLVRVARLIHPDREFVVVDAVDFLTWRLTSSDEADWVVFGWVRSMLVENGYEPYWRELYELANRVARKGVIVVD